MYDGSVAGVYISYPFCAQKCTYCNFASGVFPRSLKDEYQRALVAEIGRQIFHFVPETVYLGGGTPSSMDLVNLEVLLARLPGHPWKEATLEAAPGDITREKAQAWRSLGINRVSLGVQSFVQAEIARTGRRHTAETVASDVETLKEAGIENYNIDLIAGLAGQTMASWRESLEWISRLAPPHVSVYMLEIDEDSRLGRESLLGGVRYGARDLPNEEDTARMYELAVENLERLGIHRYEISNFARSGSESAHNLKYWNLEPYAGFGADAHSFDGARRWSNPESPADYIANKPASECSEADLIEERFFVGLRLAAGIHPTPEEWRRFDEPIRRFVAEGLLEAESGALRLSNRGVLLSNEIFQEFIGAPSSTHAD